MRTLLLFVFLLGTLSMHAVNPGMDTRADRSYQAREWPQAQALYLILADGSTHQSLPYARAIVSSTMRGDTMQLAPLLEKALSAGVPLDSVMGRVEKEFLALGKGSLYVDILNDASAQLPYLRRPIDARLLEYYRFRRNPAKTIEYANRLLAGLPDDPRYLNALAWAYATEGNFEEAETQWRKILASNPDDVEALSALGLAIKDSRPDEALPLLEKAESLSHSQYLRQLIDTMK